MPERKGRAVPCRGTSACDEPLTQEQDEVCHAGVVAQLEQERADLLTGRGLVLGDELRAGSHHEVFLRNGCIRNERRALRLPARLAVAVDDRAEFGANLEANRPTETTSRQHLVNLSPVSDAKR